MKKTLVATSILAATALLLCVWAASAAAAPAVKITLRPHAPSQPLELGVGETASFEVHISSPEPFTLATAMTDEYYPGRGVFWQSLDRVTHDTEAVLRLTVTGKASTAGLWAVCDWPEPGLCWPEGVAPVSIVAGVRYQGGVVVAERFNFAVRVP